MDKKDGLFHKYEVIKLSNPHKDIDAIVLEFDDAIARKAIAVWAETMGKMGYIQVEKDVKEKLDYYENL